MKPQGLLLRCYAECVDGQWQALCLDLCLAAQGERFQEVKRSLEDMILDYVRDAVVGVDRDFADVLLRRPAPLKYWLKFYFMVVMHRIGATKSRLHRLFIEPLPLVPARAR